MRPKNLAKEEAIRSLALQIIADEGLENLTMQKLAMAANISPRTIYIKYENKEDLLIKLFIGEVLDAYEKAMIGNFRVHMDFAEGVRLLWSNAFSYLKNNRPAFILIQYGKSSPLLNNAYRQRNIRHDTHFTLVHEFLKLNASRGVIKYFPMDVYRSLLFSPLLDLVNEYFDHQGRRRQIVTKNMLMECCDAVIKGLHLSSNQTIDVNYPKA